MNKKFKFWLKECPNCKTLNDVIGFSKNVNFSLPPDPINEGFNCKGCGVLLEYKIENEKLYWKLFGSILVIVPIFFILVLYVSSYLVELLFITLLLYMLFVFIFNINSTRLVVKK